MCERAHDMNTPARGRGRGFTLAELLVAMAIIVLVATITIVAVYRIAKDARMSQGTNSVVAAVTRARSLAMQNNESILVVFNARWNPLDPDERQYTEIVLGEWAGSERYLPGGGNPAETTDRFIPIENEKTYDLPPGIKVAGPYYVFTDYEDIWQTQPELPLTDPTLGSNAEWTGRMIAVMFGPDGSLVTHNDKTGATSIYIDFDKDEFFDRGASGYYYRFDEPGDEGFVNWVPYLAVYDDDAAREVKVLDWTGGYTNMDQELLGPDGWITRRSTAIHFNRYTGVVMR